MSQSSSLDPELLAIIVCPQCHGALRAEPEGQPTAVLACVADACRLRYPVRDGIPILLVDEAERGA